MLWSADCQQPVLDPHVPEDLDGALVHDVCPWRVRSARVLLHEHVCNAVARQQQRSSQPRRPSTDDEDGDANLVHDTLLEALKPSKNFPSHI